MRYGLCKVWLVFEWQHVGGATCLHQPDIDQCQKQSQVICEAAVKCCSRLYWFICVMPEWVEEVSSDLFADCPMTDAPVYACW